MRKSASLSTKLPIGILLCSAHQGKRRKSLGRWRPESEERIRVITGAEAARAILREAIAHQPAGLSADDVQLARDYLEGRDAAIELGKLRQDYIQHRKGIEWKVNISTWSGIGVVTFFSYSTSIFQHPFRGLALAQHTLFFC